MPKVIRVSGPSVQQQLGPTPQAQAPGTNPLQIAGQAAGQVGEVFSRLQDEEQAKADFAQRTQADTALNDINFKFMQQVANTRGMDALDLPKKLADPYSQAIQQVGTTMRTPEQKAWFANRAGEQQNRFTLSVESHSRGELETVYDQTDVQGIKSNTDTARAEFRNPKAVESAVSSIGVILQQRGLRKGLGQDLINEQIADQTSAARVEVIQGWVDAEQAKSADDSLKAYGDKLTAADRNRAENLVQGLEARQKAEYERVQLTRKFEFSQQAQDMRALAMLGQPTGQMPSAATLAQTFGPDRGMAVYRDMLVSQRLSGAMHQINTRPASEMPGLISQFMPTEQMGAAESAQAMNALQVAAQQSLNAREQDPGGFMLQSNPKLAEVWQAANSGQPKDRAAAAKLYLTMARSTGQQLGISNGSLIPKGYGDRLASELLSGENAESSATLLLTEQDKWGDQWPTVFSQMSGKLPGMMLVAGSGVSRPAAKTLASLATLKPEERNAAIETKLPDGISPASIKDAVRRQFGQFYKTFPTDAGGQSMVGNIDESATVLAKIHVGAGMSVSDASKLAYQEVAGGEPLAMVNGSPFRVPVTEAPFDVQSIERGGSLSLQGFSADTSMLIGSSPVTPDETYADRLTELVREDGRLVTRPDAKGVDVYIGSEPLHRNGRIVTWTWQELAEKGVSPTTFGELLQFAPGPL